MDITNNDRLRMSGYLHTVNALVVDMWRDQGITPADRKRKGKSAQELIKQVMGELMDHPGMRDFYGNPTCSEEIRAQEERMTL